MCAPRRGHIANVTLVVRLGADATNRHRLQVLHAAKDVCIELKQFELASKLRDLAHWVENDQL